MGDPTRAIEVKNSGNSALIIVDTTLNGQDHVVRNLEIAGRLKSFRLSRGDYSPLYSVRAKQDLVANRRLEDLNQRLALWSTGYYSRPASEADALKYLSAEELTQLRAAPTALAAYHILESTYRSTAYSDVVGNVVVNNYGNDFGVNVTVNHLLMMTSVDLGQVPGGLYLIHVESLESNGNIQDKNYIVRVP